MKTTVCNKLVEHENMEEQVLEYLYKYVHNAPHIPMNRFTEDMTALYAKMWYKWNAEWKSIKT